MTNTTASTPSIMARLKAETNELHRDAERRRLQQSLVKGDLDRDLYVGFLGQMYLVHRALEGRIEAAMDSHRAFSAVVRDYQMRTSHLHNDLGYFKADIQQLEPVKSTSALLETIDRTAATNPVALLGMHYVLEGSTNGSKFIAAALRPAFGLENQGVTYMDPHGEHQRERWAEFKRDMDAVGFTATEADTIVEAAKAVFKAVADISDELLEPAAV